MAYHRGGFQLDPIASSPENADSALSDLRNFATGNILFRLQLRWIFHLISQFSSLEGKI